MRLIYTILAGLVLMGCSHRAVSAAVQQEKEPAVARQDTLLAKLDTKLDEYVASMTWLGFEEKARECDYIISLVSDSLIRNHVAVYLYNKYLNSNLMGDEAVAIYLTDNWFTPGRAAFEDYATLATARLFADFNRQSLLGMKAPPLTAYTPEGQAAEALPQDGRLKVLFIYDTSCATCKLESVLMEEFFSGYSGQEFDFVAFYAGSDAAAWQQWRDSHFNGLADGNSPIRLQDFWDPEVESDFQRKYGVLSTPRIFLIDEDGYIAGRRLDAQALRQLLQ